MSRKITAEDHARTWRVLSQRVATLETFTLDNNLAVRAALRGLAAEDDVAVREELGLYDVDRDEHEEG
jgi:hypothetical protein